MAHKIKFLRKKHDWFPKANNESTLKELITDIDKRLTSVEKTLKELVKNTKD